MQAILQHAEIQHRIMEENPLLEAFDGFKELKAGGRRLSAAEVRLLGVDGWMMLSCFDYRTLTLTPSSCLRLPSPPRTSSGAWPR